MKLEMKGLRQSKKQKTRHAPLTPHDGTTYAFHQYVQVGDGGFEGMPCTRA